MTASITQASTFAEVYVSAQPGGPVGTGWTLSGVFWSLDDGTKGRVYLHGNSNLPEIGTDERDDLEVLWAIYGSAAGFLDGDGNAVEPTVRNLPGDNTALSDLAAAGLPNPLDPEYGNRIGHQRRLNVVLHEAAQVSQDADTGRNDITLRAGVMPAKAVPNSGNIVVRMEDWRAQGRGVDDWLLRTTDSTNENAFSDTDGAIGKHPLIRGLLDWLESIRVAGTGAPVPQSITTAAELDAAITSRDFQFEQSPGATARFRFRTSLAVQVASTTRLIVLWITRISGGGYAVPDIDDINAVLDALTRTIPTTEADDEPPFGGPDVAVTGRRYYFDATGKRWLELDGDTVKYRGLDETGRAYETALGYGRSIRLANIAPNAAGEYVIPRTYAPQVAIHVDEAISGNVTLRFPEPLTLVPLAQTDVVYSVHDRRVAGTWTELLDWDGENIATLYSGQKIIGLRLTHLLNGSAELINEIEFLRKYTSQGFGEIGNFGSSNYFLHDGVRVRPIPTPFWADAFSSGTIDADAFMGTASGGFSSGTFLSNMNFEDNAGTAIKVLKPGELRYELEVNIRAATVGWVPSAHGPRLYRERGATKEFLLSPLYPGMGTYDTPSWDYLWDRDALAGDVFLDTFQYPDATTMAMADIRVIGFRKTMILSQKISRVWTP